MHVDTEQVGFEFAGKFRCVTHVAPSEKINKQFKEKKKHTTHIKKCASEKKTSASNRSKSAAKT